MSLAAASTSEVCQVFLFSLCCCSLKMSILGRFSLSKPYKTVCDQWIGIKRQLYHHREETELDINCTKRLNIAVMCRTALVMSSPAHVCWSHWPWLKGAVPDALFIRIPTIWQLPFEANISPTLWVIYYNVIHYCHKLRCNNGVI